MFRGLIVGVVIPAFNEEVAIAAAVQAVPDYVDHTIVVDDASTDATFERAHGADQSARLSVIRHPKNRGVGAALITGYQRALALGCDAVAVMAGDGQMDPMDLPSLLAPIADGIADYAKGNRFLHPSLWAEMPPTRIAGNALLSTITRWTSGYRHIFDSQCGYTAIHRRALVAIDLEGMFPRYGYPNDLLSRLGSAGLRVVDVPIRPIYGPHWKSGIRVTTLIHPIPWVLIRSWGMRVAASRRQLRAAREH